MKEFLDSTVDTYLFKMEESLKEGDWLVGNKFSIADVAMTPYVNRLAMMSMTGVWENGRLPGFRQEPAGVGSGRLDE